MISRTKRVIHHPKHTGCADKPGNNRSNGQYVTYGHRSDGVARPSGRLAMSEPPLRAVRISEADAFAHLVNGFVDQAGGRTGMPAVIARLIGDEDFLFRLL